MSEREIKSVTHWSLTVFVSYAVGQDCQLWSCDWATVREAGVLVMWTWVQQRWRHSKEGMGAEGVMEVWPGASCLYIVGALVIVSTVMLVEVVHSLDLSCGIFKLSSSRINNKHNILAKY